MKLKEWIDLLSVTNWSSAIKLNPKSGLELLDMLKELQRYRQMEKAYKENQLTEEELITLQRLLEKFGRRNWVAAYLQGGEK